MRSKIEKAKTVLVIDDEAAARTSIAFSLRDAGYDAIEASSAEEGLELAIRHLPSVVVSDIRLEGMSGIELLGKIKEIRPNIQVVLITAYGTIEDAVKAMSLGAESYLTKPINMEEVELIVQRAIEKSDLLEETQYLRQQLRETKRFDRLIGNHPKMQEIFKIIEQVAPSTANVLIYGESGTGKELIGEAIHRMSSRADGPFVKVNCHVFSETLLESELFGHEKGAFTGAYTLREGRFEMANGGTLFLDEVNVMPEVTQAKILRFLQEREFERVGGAKTLKVDVRILAATNTRLSDEVAAGNFREDLFYRLNVIPIEIPPLSERRSDIPLLVGHFIAKYARKNDRDVTEISDEALAIALNHDWPGNVRELENIIERAIIMTNGKSILPKHLSGISPKQSKPQDTGLGLGRPLYEIEREVILRTLASVNGSTKKAAGILKVSQRKIQYRIKGYQEEALRSGMNLENLLNSAVETIRAADTSL